MGLNVAGSLLTSLVGPPCVPPMAIEGAEEEPPHMSRACGVSRALNTEGKVAWWEQVQRSRIWRWRGDRGRGLDEEMREENAVLASVDDRRRVLGCVTMDRIEGVVVMIRFRRDELIKDEDVRVVVCRANRYEPDLNMDRKVRKQSRGGSTRGRGGMLMG